MANVVGLTEDEQDKALGQYIGQASKRKASKDRIASNKGVSAGQLKVSGGPGVTSAQHKAKMAAKKPAYKPKSKTPHVRFQDKKPEDVRSLFPGAKRAAKTAGKVNAAVEKGGISAGIGIGARRALGDFGAIAKDVATTVRDTVTPPLLRKGLNNLWEGTKNATKTAFTGEVTEPSATSTVGTAQAAPVPTAQAATAPAPDTETHVGTRAGTGGRDQKQTPSKYTRTATNNAKDPMKVDTTVTGPQGETITTHGKGDMSVGGSRRGARSTGARTTTVGTFQPNYGNKREKKIAPPKSIGDMIRYKREIKERDANRDFADKSKRTDTIANETAARTDLGSRKQTALDRQNALENKRTGEDRSSSVGRTKKIDALSAEYSSTTDPKRKLEIEREISVVTGKQPTRRQSKAMGMTDKEAADEKRKRTEFYNENVKKEGWFGFRTKPSEQDWYKARDAALAGSQQTAAPAQGQAQEQASAAPTRQATDARESVPIGSTYINPDDGKTYKRET